jgi:hypothetical protein
MLFWHGSPYLIDHGATLTFQHAWSGAAAWVERAYDAADHVLLGCEPDLDAADAALAPQVTLQLLRAAADAVPDRWLADEPGFADVAEVRAAFVTQLMARRDARPAWLPGIRAAIDERTAAAGPPATRGPGTPYWVGR